MTKNHYDTKNALIHLRYDLGFAIPWQVGDPIEDGDLERVVAPLPPPPHFALNAGALRSRFTRRYAEVDLDAWVETHRAALTALADTGEQANMGARITTPRRGTKQ